MSKQVSILAGLGLIGLGVLSMALMAGVPVPGFGMLGIWNIWRLWPLTVVGVGMSFVLPPLLFRHRRGLGGLFIPGMPILVTGGILFFCSVLDWWEAWEWLWPMEVLSLAAGFVLAAIWLRVIWLLIPATIMGLNGLLFQFCALTGLWNVWAVMWSIEPLSVGLPLLTIGAHRRRHGLMLAGVILCSIGGVALMGMSAILAMNWIWFGWWWLFKLIGPALLVLLGALLLLWGLTRSSGFFKTAR